jgi:pilus assembly protein CpaB
VADLLTPGARVDVVTVSQDSPDPLVLAANATVLTVRRPAKDSSLVVIALPEVEATRVAAAALGQPVAVTMR